MDNITTTSPNLKKSNHSTLHVKIHHDFLFFQKRKDEWNALVMSSSQPNVFLTFEWVSLWWKWFGQNNKLCLLEIIEGNRLVAIVPLYEGFISVLPGMKMLALRFVGDGGPVYPDYLGPILAKDDAHLMESIADLVMASAGSNVVAMLLSSMQLDSSDNKALVDFCNKNFSTETSEDEVCPYISLPGDYETFLSGLGRRRRELARRQLRKAEKKFNVRIECCDTADSVDVAFDHLRTIYSKSFRGQELNSCFNRDDYFGFHREVAKSFADNKWLRLYLLWFDERPVAFVYGYMFNNIYWYYQTAYDQEYRDSGAGSVAIQLVIKSVIDQGAKEFDFLRGDEAYKFHFADGHRQMCMARVFIRKNPASFAYRFKRWGRKVIANL